MLSAHLVLVCAAVATAVPLPSKHYPRPTAAPPSPPPSSSPDSLIEIDSKLSSLVHTSGGAIVTTTGSTSGAGSVATVIKGPGMFSKRTAAGQSGVTGSSASSGDGLALQKSRAKTVVDDTIDGTKVKTGTQGKGITTGGAVAAQKASAEGGINNIKAIKHVETDGKHLYQVEHVERTAGNSASNHEASSNGFGTFNVFNLGSTKLNTPGLPSQSSQPSGSAPKPKPTPKPKHWNPKPEPVSTTASPKSVLWSDSKVKQAGKTTGSGAITSTVATQGSGSSDSAIKTPTGSAKESAVANSGVASTGVSSGNGLYKQGAKGKTVVAKTAEGVKVTTVSTGHGKTDGTAGTLQNVAANGGFTGFNKLDLDLPGLSIGGVQKVTGTSSTGHKASIAGPGQFNAKNVVGTDIKLKTLNLDDIALPKLP